MPSMSGWVLRVDLARESFDHLSFYALDVGLGVARGSPLACRTLALVSMPSMSGWVLRGARSRSSAGSSGFYALDVGLGVASVREGDHWKLVLRFLCPRCRAGCCEQARQMGSRGDGGFLCPRCRAGCCELVR